MSRRLNKHRGFAQKAGKKRKAQEFKEQLEGERDKKFCRLLGAMIQPRGVRW